MSQPTKRFLVSCFVIFAILNGLGMGALQKQQAFLKRGIVPALPEPILGAGVQLGINADLRQYPPLEWAEQLERMKNAGITHLKHPFYYTPQFDWQEAEAIAQAITQADLVFVPLLDGNPAEQFAPPTDPNQFAQWAGEFAYLFSDYTQFYIIWDEPNLASHWGHQPVNPTGYAALLSATAQTIRQADANALIVLAPLAPTVETGPQNLAETVYLQMLYEIGAKDSFDLVAGKPYGFSFSPEDRTVATHRLNFSRIILLREVMERNGDAGKAIWAGNWGWNSLPTNWQNTPSIWGEVPAEERVNWTKAGLYRARTEWAWMGVMFLEHWQSSRGEKDAHQGFNVAGTPLETQLTNLSPIAYPGFHFADPTDPAQSYQGTWQFSSQFGADMPNSSETTDPTQNSMTFRFWGTAIGLRVRRADYRARFFVTIDGQPANALPRDEKGRTMLILTAEDPAEDYITIEPLAQNLSVGEHVLRLEPYRGWNQWALQGFSVAYHPSYPVQQALFWGLGAITTLALMATIIVGRQTDWGLWGHWLKQYWNKLTDQGQLAWVGLLALMVTLFGWLVWGEQTAGIYRRLGDLPQLALTATAATIFYVTPSFFAYLIALLVLFFLIYLRPAWGLALIAATLPWAVKPKPMGSYLFSPVEIFILLTFAATLLSHFTHYLTHSVNSPRLRPQLQLLDKAVLLWVAVATLSLPFTERLGVASNEWRTVIIEPALIFFLFRLIPLKPSEIRTILDALLVGGLIVALIGLGQYFTGLNLITAEAGLERLRSIYGSPNNVALYLGRVLPFLIAGYLWGQGHRRWVYGGMFLLIGLAWLLSFSKGGLFLGMPASLLVFLLYWQRTHHRPLLPIILTTIGITILGLVLVWQIPALAQRLDPRGETGFLRLNLWQASLEMAIDHPWLGVGLDNFLYQYRGNYIFDTAWREPNLSHPHNFLLDFATRLGILGLVAGGWLFYCFAQLLRIAQKQGIHPEWQPIWIGMVSAFTYMLAHGLVDHSFFLTDLAGFFYFMLGISYQVFAGKPPSIA